MADGEGTRPTIRDLDLTPRQADALSEMIAASIAVNVYRQAAQLRGDTGCQVIANCCSCSKVEQVVTQ